MDSEPGRGRTIAASPLERVTSGLMTGLEGLRTMGVERWLRMEREALAQTVKITGACVLSWWLAAYVLKVEIPVLVPIGVLLTMSATAYSSLVRGAQQVGAVVTGVAAATAVIWLLGYNAVTLAVLVVAGLVLTRLLNLPAQNVQIPITALLVFALGSTYGFERLADVLVGAGIGIAASFLIMPPRFVDKASHELAALSDELADLAEDMAEGLRNGWDEDMASDWLARARTLSQRLEDTEEAAEEAAEAVRLSPRRSRYNERMDQVADAATCLDHACHQLRGIARGLVDLIAGVRGLPGERGADMPELLADELASLSRGFRAFSMLQHGRAKPSDLDDLRAALNEGHRQHERLAEVFIHTGHMELRLLQGALLDDCARIRHEIDPDTGPHKAAFPHA
ncbi:aromatic acid exporter family protein [Nonomuraea terrae]|uniref:aromatic acid exporter family protein n=1 Tax=Nonomuraea terrae TaxID=2530383 RepID=UPI0037877682